MNFIQIYFRKRRRFLESITDMRILLLLLIATCASIGVLFFLVHTRTKVIEPKISLAPLPTNITPVTTGILVKHFTTFDVLKDKFTLDATVWFSYDNTTISVDDLGQFYFERGTITHKSNPIISTHNNANIVKYDITVQLRSNLYYQQFPFDNHRIDIILSNPVLNNKSISLVCDDQTFSVMEHAVTNEWKIIKTNCTHGVKKTPNSNMDFEQTVFSLYVARNSSRTLFLLFIPLFAIFCIGLFSLTFDVAKNFSAILSLSVGSTTGLLFYRNVINELIPYSDYFTISDRIYTLLLALIMIALTIQIYLLHYNRKRAEQTQLEELLKYTAMSLNIVRSCFFIFFLLVTLIATIMLVW